MRKVGVCAAFAVMIVMAMTGCGKNAIETEEPKVTPEVAVTEIVTETKTEGPETVGQTEGSDSEGELRTLIRKTLNGREWIVNQEEKSEGIVCWMISCDGQQILLLDGETVTITGMEKKYPNPVDPLGFIWSEEEAGEGKTYLTTTQIEDYATNYMHVSIKPSGDCLDFEFAHNDDEERQSVVGQSLLVTVNTSGGIRVEERTEIRELVESAWLGGSLDTRYEDSSVIYQAGTRVEENSRIYSVYASGPAIHNQEYVFFDKNDKEQYSVHADKIAGELLKDGCSLDPLYHFSIESESEGTIFSYNPVTKEMLLNGQPVGFSEEECLKLEQDFQEAYTGHPLMRQEEMASMEIGDNHLLKVYRVATYGRFTGETPELVMDTVYYYSMGSEILATNGYCQDCEYQDLGYHKYSVEYWPSFEDGDLVALAVVKEQQTNLFAADGKLLISGIKDNGENYLFWSGDGKLLFQSKAVTNESRPEAYPFADIADANYIAEDVKCELSNPDDQFYSIWYEYKGAKITGEIYAGEAVFEDASSYGVLSYYYDYGDDGVVGEFFW